VADHSNASDVPNVADHSNTSDVSHDPNRDVSDVASTRGAASTPSNRSVNTVYTL